jgi:hypothetical protein
MNVHISHMNEAIGDTTVHVTHMNDAVGDATVHVSRMNDASGDATVHVSRMNDASGSPQGRSTPINGDDNHLTRHDASINVRIANGINGFVIPVV